MALTKLNYTGQGTIPIANIPTITGAKLPTIPINKMPNAPTFSAYQSTIQTIAATTLTKLNYQTILWDTNSNFDTTNMRFLPTVSGYYQVTASLQMGGYATTGQLYFYKNGSMYKQVTSMTATSAMTLMSGTTLVFLNGSTDFVEVIVYINGGQNLSASQTGTYFMGALVKNG